MFEKIKKKCVSIERVCLLNVVGVEFLAAKRTSWLYASNTGAFMKAQKSAGTNPDPLRAFENH